MVGTGTAASCTDAALNAALAGGGLVTFNCGSAPVTIDISTGTGTKTIAADTTIDGGGLITISGGNSVGVFSRQPWRQVHGPEPDHRQRHAQAPTAAAASSTMAGTLTVTNSTFSGNSAAPRRRPSSTSGTLTVTNSTFSGNSAGNGGGGIFNAAAR